MGVSFLRGLLFMKALKWGVRSKYQDNKVFVIATGVRVSATLSLKGFLHKTSFELNGLLYMHWMSLCKGGLPSLHQKDWGVPPRQGLLCEGL
eukprot:6485932-Amphidinium_carterae.2